MPILVPNCCQVAICCQETQMFVNIVAGRTLTSQRKANNPLLPAGWTNPEAQSAWTAGKLQARGFLILRLPVAGTSSIECIANERGNMFLSTLQVNPGRTSSTTFPDAFFTYNPTDTFAQDNRAPLYLSPVLVVGRSFAIPLRIMRWTLVRMSGTSIRSNEMRVWGHFGVWFAVNNSTRSRDAMNTDSISGGDGVYSTQRQSCSASRQGSTLQ
jgi:hypothetical protein